MFRTLAWIGAAVPVALLLAVFALRVAYPYELEWQEGGMLAHVIRLRAGEPLYGEPSLEFLPFPYPPLFIWCAAAASSVLGEGFTALRLVSILASIGLGTLVVAVYRRRGDALGGALAVGLFCASYRFAGAWLDVGRVDALFLALVGVGWAFASQREVEPHGSLAQPTLAGIAFALAFLAKQSALVVAAGLAVGWLVRDRGAALVFVVALVGGVALSTGMLMGGTDGWYGFWVFEQLAGHSWVRAQLVEFWVDLARVAGPMLGLSAVALFRKEARDARVLGLVVGLLLAAWSMRVHVGAYDNAFLPAVLGLALLAGPELSRLVRGRALLALLGLLALGGQGALFYYDPRLEIPAEADRAQGDALVQELAREAGEVLVPYHGYLARRAGRPSGAHAMAVIDLLQSDDRDAAARWVRSLEAALREQRWGLIWLDDTSWEEDLPALLESYRRVQGPLDGAPPERFRPVTGADRRPLYAYRPRVE